MVSLYLYTLASDREWHPGANATKRSGHFHNDLVTWPCESSKIVRLFPWPLNTPIGIVQSKVPERRPAETPRRTQSHRQSLFELPREIWVPVRHTVQQRSQGSNHFKISSKVVMTRKTILLNGSNHGYDPKKFASDQPRSINCNNETIATTKQPTTYTKIQARHKQQREQVDWNNNEASAHDCIGGITSQ
jgi:hypothetical protein